MTPDSKPTVTVVHRIPGRVRVRLSASPDDVGRMKTAILEHPGLSSIDYTHVTRSLVVRFDPRMVSQEEIVLRIALCLSLDYGSVPVRVLAEPERVVLADTAVYSAFGLAASVAARWLGGTRQVPTRLDWVAAGGTGLAVVDHARRDLDEKGHFDPEVLSLAYLAAAMARGDFLKASVVTWLVTFGRHLLDLPPAGVEIRPLQVRGPNHPPRYELVIGPDCDAPQRIRVLGALEGLLKYAMTGGGAHSYRTLLEELQEVSKVHGKVLEGFGPVRQGIPLRFDRGENPPWL